MPEVVYVYHPNPIGSGKVKFITLSGNQGNLTLTKSQPNANGLSTSGHIVVSQESLIPRLNESNSYDIPVGTLICFIDGSGNTYIAETAQPLLVTGPPKTILGEQ